MNGTCTYATTYYQDNDGDGYGNALASTTSCSQPDGYVTNDEDCNDGNNTQYPGAPGTASNIDNNCNGTLDPAEIDSCAGDFNFDGVINVSDLLLFMANYGCLSGCAPFDLTGDGVVNVNDLLIFMAVYGTSC